MNNERTFDEAFPAIRSMVDICRDIGNITDTNNHFQWALFKRLSSIGRPMTSLTVAELLSVIQDETRKFNSEEETDQVTTSEQLPPCPCCKSTNLIHVELFGDDYDGPGIECQTCFAQAPTPAWMMIPEAPVLDLPLKTLESFAINVLVFDYDAEQQAEISLPFEPYPGLKIQVPFQENDYAEIDEVYWSTTDSQFVVYLQQAPVAHPNDQVTNIKAGGTCE